MITEKHKKIFAQCKGCGKSYSDGLLSVKVKSKWGFINTDGELVIPAIYDNVKEFEYEFHNGLAIVVSNTKYGIINKDSAEILPCEYDAISYSYGKYSIQKSGKTSIGFSNNGELVVTSFPSAYPPVNGYCIVRGESKKKGLVQTDGTVIANAEYDDIKSSFHNGVVTASKGANLFIINDKGTIIKTIDTKASGYILTDFYGGLASVKNGDKFGVINTEGDIVISPEYDELELESFIDFGCIKASKDGHYGLIGPDGKIITDFQYDNINCFDKGLMAVTKDNKQGVINPSGMFITNIEYDSIEWGDHIDHTYISLIKKVPNKDGKKDRWDQVIMEEDVTVMDLKGEIIGNICSYKVHMSKHLLFIVMTNDMKYGLCDCAGKYLIPLENSNLAFCTPELFRIKKDGKCGYCDKNGRMYTEYEYNDMSSSFDNDTFVLFGKGDDWSGYQYGIISKEGKIIAECKYSEINPFSEGYAVAKLDKAFGLIDESGNSTF